MKIAKFYSFNAPYFCITPSIMIADMSTVIELSFSWLTFTASIAWRKS
jgi:hypothetical protein